MAGRFYSDLCTLVPWSIKGAGEIAKEPCSGVASLASDSTGDIEDSAGAAGFAAVADGR